MSSFNAANIAGHGSSSFETRSKMQARINRLFPTINQLQQPTHSKPDCLERESENHNPGTSKKLVSQFCSFTLLAKFPYKYMKDTDGVISRDFFAANKFYNRMWHLYYLHPPDSVGGKPLILVPFGQARSLINEIATTLEQNLTVPQFPFTIPFYDDNTPQPQFLGVSNCRSDATTLQSQVQPSSPGFGQCPAEATLTQKADFEAWIKKFSETQLAAGSRSKTSKNGRNVGENSMNITECYAQAKRAQQYLGLRPGVTVQALRSQRLRSQVAENWDFNKLQNDDATIEFFDATKCVPYLFDYEPVFICVDIEADERNHKLITEIGVSTLDTRDLNATPPSPTAQSWLSKIRSRHFRIRGTERIRNQRWCVGNPNGFGFGESEWVSLFSAAEAIDSCFEWPYSRRQSTSPALRGDFESDEDSNVNGVRLFQVEDAKQTLSSPNSELEDRNIILVGHDIEHDIAYLSSLGSEIFGLSTGHDLNLTESDSSARKARPWILTRIIECLDTAILDRTIQGASQTRSLAKLCESLGIETWGLHNAGNDAHYTLEALIKLVLYAREREDTQYKSENPNDSAIKDTAEEIKTQVHIQHQMAVTSNMLKSRLEEATASRRGFKVSFRKGLPTVDLEKDAKTLLEEDASLTPEQKKQLLCARHGINLNDPALQMSWNTLEASYDQSMSLTPGVQGDMNQAESGVTGLAGNISQEIPFEKVGKKAKRVQPKHGW